jgi:UDP-3-O-[3-hydroxymyristoyl] glucosamine N-acyltransferase
MTMQASVSELAALVGGEIEGCADLIVHRAAAADEGGEDAVVLAEDENYFQRAVQSNAGCILTRPGMGKPAAGRAVIATADPMRAFARILGFFKGQERLPSPGIGVGAVVERGARLGTNVAIGPNCYVGEGASLGDGCVLFAGVYIGDGVSIGDESKLYPGVTVYPDCRIGRRVILHAGTVIGADGFGYASDGTRLQKFPHLGTVEIGDDVEIGANSAVDRAKIGATVIGRGTKIDNLVHVAHNVKIGSNCVIVALSGVAGSVEIGDNVTLAAQAGISDHVRIGDGCVVAARGGVIGDLAAGSTVSGFPARDHRAEMRMQAMQLRLPEIMSRLRALEKELGKQDGQAENTADDNTHN